MFSLSQLSFYGLVLWGWGLRTNRVLIGIKLPALNRQPFLITIIILITSGVVIILEGEG